jgi:hypothetical protein
MSQSRAQFLTRAGRGGVGLVAGGALLASATPGVAATSAAAASGDAAIARLAATAELLAIDFYTNAIAGGAFKASELEYLHQARRNEQDHYHALAGVLRGGGPKNLRFQYPANAFSSRLSAARLGVALETAFVGAYLGAVTALKANALKGVAAQIGASESQHLSVFSDIATGAPIGPSFPQALSAGKATAAVSPFLA